ncbi:MAG TPA: cytochrome P450 [Acidimicrobiia bacterium]|nr:cytochrome P450 [Acidimicrobiia bacterium]
MTEFDAYALEFVEDPYPTYARFRAERPVFFDEHWDVTFFARHADVSGILRDRRFGRDVRSRVPEDEIDADVLRRTYPPDIPTWTEYVRDSFIDLEPPAHTRIRRLVQWAFTRKASESYRPRLEEVAARSIDLALERGGMEAIADFATPIPLVMIADLLGIPPADQPMLVAWSHAMVRPFDADCPPADRVAAEQATRDFVAYLTDLTRDRRERPGSDLLTELVAAEFEGDRLSEQEVVATAILTLNAGHEATVQAIGNGLLALARHPDQFEALKVDPDLVTPAASEILRFDTPLQMFERWVLEDVEWNGTPLRRGSKVGLFFGSANHDEEVFADPETFDIARDSRAHLAFGAGIHHCVGAPLAKLELEVAMEAVRRLPRLVLVDEDFERVPSLVFRGVKELRLAVG